MAFGKRTIGGLRHSWLPGRLSLQVRLVSLIVLLRGIAKSKYHAARRCNQNEQEGLQRFAKASFSMGGRMEERTKEE